MKDHDQAESARKLQEYKERSEREPQPISHEFKPIAEVTHLMEEFYRKPKNKQTPTFNPRS